jgi:hypothetical protein
MGDVAMRWSVLLPFLALGVPACVDIPSPTPSATPEERIGVPAADRLLLERVSFTPLKPEVVEWAESSI